MNAVSQSGRLTQIPERVIKRLIHRIRIHRDHWLYVPPCGGKLKFNYPRIGWQPRGELISVLGVHELAARIWLRENGPLHVGEEVHHVCGVEGCFNPSHLHILDADSHRRKHWFARSVARQMQQQADEVAAELARKGLVGVVV